MGAMINRRRVIGGKSLPYDAEIEYLESSNARQEIDTLISANPTIGVRGSVCIIEPTNQNVCLGCTENGVFNNGKGFGYDVNGSCYVGGLVTPVQRFNVFTWINFSVNYLNDNTCTLNNIEKTIIKGTQSTDIHITLYNFSRGDGRHSTYSPRSCRFRNVTFTQGNVVIRDFIPVRVGQVGYMYDKISGELFGNTGTGDFILGPDKGPENPVNISVKTHSTGGSNASIDVTTGDSEPVNILFSTNYWVNKYIGITYNSNSGWKLFAITSCLYNGEEYSSGELIANWRYDETKDISLVANI